LSLHLEGPNSSTLSNGLADQGRKRFSVNFVCRRAGLVGVSRHTLKHTAITWACQSGKATLWELAGFFATTMKTMEDKYAHHHPDQMTNAAAAVGD
jgi:hypothetical protein